MRKVVLMRAVITGRNQRERSAALATVELREARRGFQLGGFPIL